MHDCRRQQLYIEHTTTLTNHLFLGFRRWKRREKDRTQYNSLMIVLNMSLSLVGLYVCFLIAGHSVSNKIACGIFSALLQYFFLVFFGWTSAYAMYLFFLTVTWMSESRYTRGYILRASLIVWCK